MLMLVVGIVYYNYAKFATIASYYGPVIGIIFKIDCLRLFVVVYKLVVLMCISAFIVTSADISQLWVYLLIYIA